VRCKIAQILNCGRRWSYDVKYGPVAATGLKHDLKQCFRSPIKRYLREHAMLRMARERNKRLSCSSVPKTSTLSDLFNKIYVLDKVKLKI
jgi:hypothetical protein